jgi:hypothetical protein
MSQEWRKLTLILHASLTSRHAQRSRSATAPLPRRRRRCAARLSCPAPLFPPSRAADAVFPVPPVSWPHPSSLPIDHGQLETASQLSDGNCRCRSWGLPIVEVADRAARRLPPPPVQKVRTLLFSLDRTSIVSQKSPNLSPQSAASAARRLASGARSARTTRRRRRGGALLGLQVQLLHAGGRKSVLAGARRAINFVAIYRSLHLIVRNSCAIQILEISCLQSWKRTPTPPAPRRLGSIACSCAFHPVHLW